MTPWQQVFEDQQLVKRLEDVLHSLDGISLDGLQAAQLEQYSRLLKVLKFIRARLKSIDPELVSQTSLNNMGNWLTNIANHIANFLSSKDFAYIQSANTTADSILDVVRAFRTTAKEHEQAIGGATTAFRDRI